MSLRASLNSFGLAPRGTCVEYRNLELVASRNSFGTLGRQGKTLEIEDERGEKIQGREAFNIVFSMPVVTPPEAVRAATADAARELFEGHNYVLVMHEDQGAPRVHLSVRADWYDGLRLSPRKADLDRWRAVFARNLQDRGVNAVASRQPVRAVNRNYRKLWEERAASRGQLTRQRPAQRTSSRALAVRAEALKAWEQIAVALARSKDPEDVRLAVETVRYLSGVTPGGREVARLIGESARQHKDDRFKAAGIAPAAKQDRDR